MDYEIDSNMDQSQGKSQNCANPCLNSKGTVEESHPAAPLLCYHLVKTLQLILSFS